MLAPFDGDDYMVAFNAVRAELQTRLGSSDNVNVFPIPAYLFGNFVESITFEHQSKGFTYCTCPLSQYSYQLHNKRGNFELMMSAREKIECAPTLIGGIGKYSFEAVLEQGETMGPGDLFPGETNLKALLFTASDLDSPDFQVRGKNVSLLLAIGVSEKEMNHCMKNGCDEVLKRLKDRGEFPYTTLDRKSVI